MKYVCDNCGKVFRRNASRTRKNIKIFCSKQCYHIYRKETGYGCSKEWRESR